MLRGAHSVPMLQGAAPARSSPVLCGPRALRYRARRRARRGRPGAEPAGRARAPGAPGHQGPPAAGAAGDVAVAGGAHAARAADLGHTERAGLEPRAQALRKGGARARRQGGRGRGGRARRARRAAGLLPRAAGPVAGRRVPAGGRQRRAGRRRGRRARRRRTLAAAGALEAVARSRRMHVSLRAIPAARRLPRFQRIHGAADDVLRAVCGRMRNTVHALSRSGSGGRGEGSSAPRAACRACRLCTCRAEAGAAESPRRARAQHITHLHAAIRSALDAFAAEAAGLRTGGALGAAALAALVERHRFLRAVCAFHSASEDDVVFPAARSADARRGRAAPRRRAPPVVACFVMLKGRRGPPACAAALRAALAATCQAAGPPLSAAAVTSLLLCGVCSCGCVCSETCGALMRAAGGPGGWRAARAAARRSRRARRSTRARARCWRTWAACWATCAPAPGATPPVAPAASKPLLFNNTLSVATRSEDGSSCLKVVHVAVST